MKQVRGVRGWVRPRRKAQPGSARLDTGVHWTNTIGRNSRTRLHSAGLITVPMFVCFCQRLPQRLVLNFQRLIVLDIRNILQVVMVMTIFPRLGRYSTCTEYHFGSLLVDGT